jgi:hypothetical protein
MFLNFTQSSRSSKAQPDSTLQDISPSEDFLTVLFELIDYLFFIGPPSLTIVAESNQRQTIRASTAKLPDTIFL